MPANKQQKTKSLSAIAATAAIINQLTTEKKSFTECFSHYQNRFLDSDAAKIQAYCYNLLRRYEFYQFIADSLLSKKLKNKDQDIYHLILCGLMLLNEANLPAHAAINETVNVTKKSKKSWSKNLLNALLRRYQREQATLHAAAKKQARSLYCCPDWLLKKIQQSYSESDSATGKPLWQSILKANLSHPPMSLRVNALRQSRNGYLHLLAKLNIAARACTLTQHGILLEQAVAVEKLPLFANGAVSVQDSAAQLSGELLRPQKNDRILDACAAPGGKTLHLLESCPELEKITAIDISAKRLERVKQNIHRLTPDLASKIELITADAGNIEQWWDNNTFDRILLDAPCSASGIIRRHPDIKRLRQPAHIDELIKTQQMLLKNLWCTLKSGGFLLYATCSILPEENSLQIKRFLSTHNDAKSIDFDVSWGIKKEFGRQLLPTFGEQPRFNGDTFTEHKITSEKITKQPDKNRRNSDGFYYCLLQKK